MAVDKKIVEWWEIRSNNWYLYICHHKAPEKITTESEVNVDGSPAINSDGRPIRCVEDVVDSILAVWDQLVLEHADVWASVDQKPVLGRLVGYERAGRIDGAAIHRH